MAMVAVTDKIHEWSKAKAEELSQKLGYDVKQEGLVGVLLVLALSDEKTVRQAIEILKQYRLGGATDMQNKGW